MKEHAAYDAVDLLDADHKAVKKLFILYDSLCKSGAPVAAKRLLALRICEALAIHAQIEEEIFFPQVRKAIGDDALMDGALQEHAEAREAIARIEAMTATHAGHDTAVKRLRMLIDLQVLEERERIFPRARQSPVDLRGMTLRLVKRQLQLRTQFRGIATKEAA